MPFSHHVDVEPLISLFAVTQDGRHVVFSSPSTKLVSVQERMVYFKFIESCGDGEMWVSVLVLGAAEHPVPPLLPGPQHPCLSVAASSLIKLSWWRSLPSATREREDVTAGCKGPWWILTWTAWMMRFMNENIFVGVLPQWSQRPWLILVPVVQCFELVALPTTNQLQSYAGLFYLSEALTPRGIKSFNL